MVYTILISVVFIAELIIAITILQNLVRLDKFVLETDKTLENAKKGITDICILSKKISEQFEILAQDFISKTKQNSEDILLKYCSRLLISLLVINLNFKFINKIRKSKITKMITKGFSFIENMV